MIIYPKNKFQQLVSFAFERSMPTLQYFVWNPMTYHARRMGWTEQEKLYHNFFRGSNMMYHSYAQSIHPMGYLERQRADAFIRRLEDVLPGMEAPEWAHHHRRAVDFDFEGAVNPLIAMDVVNQENTPKTHYGLAYPSGVSHVGNYRYLLGFWAQRLFFNEEIKGSAKEGYYTEEQKKNLNSWYATPEDYKKLEINNKTKEELEEYIKNSDKWMKNIETFYPEYKNYKVHATPNKFREPYYERTVQDITQAIFIQKWTSALEKKVFTPEEVQGIYEFYIHQRDEVFWTASEEDGLFHPTALYAKFQKTLDLPNVFDLEKFTSKVVEEQYRDLLQINYGINFATVEQFRRQHLKFIQELNEKKDIPNSEVKRLRVLISEEVYNPLFRNKASDHAKGALGSYVVAAYKQNGASAIEAFELLQAQTADELHFINRENQEAYLNRIRNVVKTFPINTTPVVKVQF
jgi:hypothetical protein